MLNFSRVSTSHDVHHELHLWFLFTSKEDENPYLNQIIYKYIVSTNKSFVYLPETFDLYDSSKIITSG